MLPNGVTRRKQGKGGANPDHPKKYTGSDGCEDPQQNGNGGWHGKKGKATGNTKLSGKISSARGGVKRTRPTQHLSNGKFTKQIGAHG